MTRPTTPDGLRAAMADRPLRSTFVKLAALEVVDLLAATALDAVVVDLEHSQLDEGEARRLVRHATARGLPALVRVPSVDPGAVNRILEAGAVGIQLSGVTDAAQVGALVAATRHPPAGTRSTSLAQPAAGYGATTVADHVAAPGGPPLLVGQVEHDPGEGAAALVAGLDVAFAGTTDLSVALGRPGRTDHPEVVAALGRIAAGARAAGVAFGGWAPGADAAGPLEAEGARYLTLGSDLAALRGALIRELGAGTPRP
ncbi:MAG: HpcH/HpaI aldolase/citrate lyase family protein [Acidimicrobiia bacterium]